MNGDRSDPSSDERFPSTEPATPVDQQPAPWGPKPPAADAPFPTLDQQQRRPNASGHDRPSGQGDAPAPPNPFASPFRQPIQANRVQYQDDGAAITKIAIRGALLTLITLGLYRFWLTTDIRRHLWSHTGVDGSQFEYTGRGSELLIGFLIALAVIVPINIVFFIVILDQDETIANYSGLILAVIYAFLGQYAVFRARRYRLTRTIFRGLRFWQSGSGWSYAMRSAFWSIVTVLTLGLAYPFQAASLERYKVGHTWFGDRQADFTATGRQLLARGFWLWLICALPALVGAAIVLADQFDTGAGPPQSLLLPSAALLGLIPGTIATLALAVLLYPVFLRIRYRWWASGVRLGDFHLESDITAGKIYTLYLLFYVIISIVVSIVTAVLGILTAIILVSLGIDLEGLTTNSLDTEVGTIVALIVYYAAIISAITVVEIAYFRRRWWSIHVRSLTFTGIETLETVQARGKEASAFGEGFADALDVGGF